MISPEWLLFFQRSFAARPSIIVFQNVKEHGCASVECPFTHRRIYGISGPLYWEMRHAIYCGTGRDISKEFEVEYTHNDQVQIVFLDPAMPIVFLTDGVHPPTSAKTVRLVLAPKAITA